LALEVPEWFKNKKNFKKRFRVDKKYLFFMRESNITLEEFKILQIYPTTDIKVLRFLKSSCWDIERLKNRNIDLSGIKKYLKSQNLSSHFLWLSLYGKRIKVGFKRVYLRNLREANDELYNQIEVINDPLMDEKIKRLSAIFSLNKYEDEN